MTDKCVLHNAETLKFRVQNLYKWKRVKCIKFRQLHRTAVGMEGLRFVDCNIQLNTLILLQQYQQFIKPLNTELNPICHLLALLGSDHILHISRKRFKSPLAGLCLTQRNFTLYSGYTSDRITDTSGFSSREK